MALYTTPDGRVIVGSGIDNGNDYHGFNGKRDIVIQLTADGATTDGLNALEYLKSYAENAKQENKPIFPDGTRVFISANGYTKAVEADDVVIDGSNISIGGIVWNGSAWDYSGAGQVASSLPEVGADDNGKVLTVVDGEWAAANGGGSGGGVLVVHEEDDTLDKTWREITNAVASTGAVVVSMWNGELIGARVVAGCDFDLMSQKYMLTVIAGRLTYYAADSESDYPVYSS